MKPSKIEIKWAKRAISEQLDLIAEIRRTEGNTEANKNAMFGDTVQRMRRAIAVLRQAHEPIPTLLTINWSWYRSCGWHNELVVPA